MATLPTAPGGLTPAVPSPAAPPTTGNGNAIPAAPGPQEAEGGVFPFFTPSFDLPLVGAVMATALVVIHLSLALRKRTIYFGPVMTSAALMFGIGMTTRLIVVMSPAIRQPFIVSSLVLMITSAIASTALIFTYTRLIWWITPAEHRTISNLWLPPRATSLILVLLGSIGDVVSTLGGGQIIQPAPLHLQATGAVLKMLVWISFFGLVARFTVISRRWSMDAATRKGSLELGLALTASSFLLAILGIMNVLEKDALETLKASRRPGSILTTEEWPTWVFNFLPTLLIISIMAVYHPGYYLPKRLTGLRLKGKELVTMEMIRDEEDPGGPGGSTAKNGWIISKPTAVSLDKEDVIEMNVQMYERTGPLPVGYVR